MAETFKDFVPEAEAAIDEPASEPFYPPPQEKEEAAEIGIIREFNPLKVIEMERHYLRGEYWDEEKKRYVMPKGTEPFMNEKGISKYLSMVTTPVCSLVTFSNYDKEDVSVLTRYICEQSIPVLYVNYKDYGIDKINLPVLSSHIFFWTYAALKKGLGAGDRNLVRGSVQESIATRYGPQPQRRERKGFRLNPFGRGG